MRVAQARSQDGSVAVVMALAMVLFLSLLTVVIDAGQLFTARILLTSGTDAASLEAAQRLSDGGCAAFVDARNAATGRLADHSSTAVIDVFEVTYGATVVDDVSDCTSVTSDENVGRVDLRTRDTRTLSFAGFFTSGQGTTTASTAVEWGYVADQVDYEATTRPLSLCALNTGYQDYLAYLAAQELHVANPGVNPPPDPALLDPFDLEIDALEGSPCETDPTAKFGEFVLVDFASGDKNALISWMANGSPVPLAVDDPATLADEQFCPDFDSRVPGACEGIEPKNTLDEVADFSAYLGEVMTIYVHDTALCDDGKPGYDHCNHGNTDHRVYPVNAFVQVRFLCLRNTAPAAAAAPVSSASSVAPGACDDLNFTSPDGTNGDDVFVRMEIVPFVDTDGGTLTTTATAQKGISLCMVDGDDACGFS